MCAFNVFISSTKAFITSATAFVPTPKVFVSSTINTFVFYSKGGLENLQKGTEIRKVSVKLHFS